MELQVQSILVLCWQSWVRQEVQLFVLISMFLFIHNLAGKTTLLNALAGRASGIIEGDILLNGHPQSEAKSLMKHSAYIMQDDVLLKNQTPREVLTFSANLRLPKHVTAVSISFYPIKIRSYLGLFGGV